MKELFLQFADNWFREGRMVYEVGDSAEAPAPELEVEEEGEEGELETGDLAQAVYEESASTISRALSNLKAASQTDTNLHRQDEALVLDTKSYYAAKTILNNAAGDLSVAHLNYESQINLYEEETEADIQRITEKLTKIVTEALGEINADEGLNIDAKIAEIEDQDVNIFRIPGSLSVPINHGDIVIGTQGGGVAPIYRREETRDGIKYRKIHNLDRTTDMPEELTEAAFQNLLSKFPHKEITVTDLPAASTTAENLAERIDAVTAVGGVDGTFITAREAGFGNGLNGVTFSVIDGQLHTLKPFHEADNSSTMLHEVFVDGDWVKFKEEGDEPATTEEPTSDEPAEDDVPDRPEADIVSHQESPTLEEDLAKLSSTDDPERPIMTLEQARERAKIVKATLKANLDTINTKLETNVISEEDQAALTLMKDTLQARLDALNSADDDSLHRALGAAELALSHDFGESLTLTTPDQVETGIMMRESCAIFEAVTPPIEGSLQVPEKGKSIPNDNYELQKAIKAVFPGYNEAFSAAQNVYNFQAEYGLDHDYIAGPKTVSMINLLTKQQALVSKYPEITLDNPFPAPEQGKSYTFRGKNTPRGLFAVIHLDVTGGIANGDTSMISNLEEAVAAVEAFQEKYGLHVDGIVGPKTVAMVNRISHLRDLVEADRAAGHEEPAPAQETNTELDAVFDDEAVDEAVDEGPPANAPEVVGGDYLSEYGISIGFNTEGHKVFLDTDSWPTGADLIFPKGRIVDAKEFLATKNLHRVTSVNISSSEGVPNAYDVIVTLKSGRQLTFKLNFQTDDLAEQGGEGPAEETQETQQRASDFLTSPEAVDHNATDAQAEAESEAAKEAKVRAKKNIENVQKPEQLSAYFKKNFPGMVTGDIYMEQATTENLSTYDLGALPTGENGYVIHFDYVIGNQAFTFNEVGIGGSRGQARKNVLAQVLQQVESSHEGIVRSSYENPNNEYQQQKRNWEENHASTFPSSVSSALRENSDTVLGVSEFNIKEDPGKPKNKLTVTMTVTLADGNTANLEAKATGFGKKSFDELLDKAMDKLAKDITKLKSGPLTNSESQQTILTAYAGFEDKPNFNLHQRLTLRAQELTGQIGDNLDAAAAKLQEATMEQIEANLDGSGSCRFDFYQLEGDKVKAYEVKIVGGVVSIYPTPDAFKGKVIKIGTNEGHGFDPEGSLRVQEGANSFSADYVRKARRPTYKNTYISLNPETLYSMASELTEGDLPSSAGHPGRIDATSAEYNILLVTEDAPN